MRFQTPPDDAPHLIRALDRIARERPLARKILVAPVRGAGRELLRTLARTRGGWAGFVVETPRPLALQLATEALGRSGLRVLDAFEEEVLVDDALDRVLAAGGPAAAYADLGAAPGFRKAVRSAVSGLRLAGIDPARIRAAPFVDPAKRALLADVLEAVLRSMAEGSSVDVSRVLKLATEALEAGASLPAEHVYLLPGLSLRGTAGRFVDALRQRGAEVLPTDAVAGLEPPAGVLWRAAAPRTPRTWLYAPDEAPEEAAPPREAALAGLPLFEEAAAGGTARNITLFRAAGIHEELREVLRRILDSGRPFDEVEIVTPDPAAYGPALHALAERSAIGVTFAVGLPVERTRPGRAVAAWLRWVADDFPAPELRRLLENHDLRAPGVHRRVNPRRLARRLRRLRVGWGRERYETLLRAALERLDAHPPEPRKDESPEDLRARVEATRGELEALRALVRHLLRHTPEVPKRLELSPRPVAPAALAEGLAAFLGLVPTRSGSVDDTAKERLLRVLDRAAATLTRPVAFGSAVGALLEHLDIRVPAPRAEGKAPWLSDGGSLHLTDLEHGGLTGRPLTFVVGLDAGRFPGLTGQDPLLLDRERAALSAALPTSTDRLEERRFQFAALFARLRGEVVLSHPAWESAEARVLAPSPVLLQAFRLAGGGAGAGFDDLRKHLGTPASRLPRGAAPLDREDVWLAALSAGNHLLEGTDVVRRAFPRLDRGQAARRAWDDPAPGPHHGVLPPRPGFDPRGHPETVLSASRLESLGRCPLQYFHRYVLRVSPPDDPEYQPDAWLGHLHRGSLLHGVFEATLRIAREDEVGVEEEAFQELSHRILHERARALRAELPPPSEAVYERELEALETDLRCFADHLRRHPAPWVWLERPFGMGVGAEPPVELALGGGRVRLRGAIDRIDRAGPDGESLRVVDYKTGGFNRTWSRATGTWHGGRRLQHLLYTLAVEALEGRPVASMEYHFPTRRGEGRIRAFGRGELEGGLELVGELLDAAARGHFVPTDDGWDCMFCDYKAVCRVTEKEWGGIDAPPAVWAAARRAEGAEVYDELGRVREREG